METVSPRTCGPEGGVDGVASLEESQEPMKPALPVTHTRTPLLLCSCAMAASLNGFAEKSRPARRSAYALPTCPGELTRSRSVPAMAPRSAG